MVNSIKKGFAMSEMFRIFYMQLKLFNTSKTIFVNIHSCIAAY